MTRCRLASPGMQAVRSKVGRASGAPHVEPPGQGVGAWTWVSREGLMAVWDMNLAGDVSGFTSSSPSRFPKRLWRL